MYARIMVPVDGSAPSARGLDEAIELARHLKARLQLVHVVEPWITVTPETMLDSVLRVTESMRDVGTALLEQCKEKVTKAGVEAETELIESTGASAGERIVRRAKELDADLIVCGTHGRRGLRRLLLGSDAEYIVRRASAPVLLVRHQEQE